MLIRRLFNDSTILKPIFFRYVYYIRVFYLRIFGFHTANLEISIKRTVGLFLNNIYILFMVSN